MKHERRGWSGAVTILLVAAACRSSSAPEPRSNEDYAVARAAFRTNLVKRGPAPQPWEPPQLPSNARTLAFDSGDLHLTAWISNDGVTTARPAVLFLHGGFAFDAGDWQMSQPFRDAGFVVMTPILRGENGQPGSFSLFHDELDDVLAAADVLARQPGVDPAHMYVAGHSVGGTLTMLTAMTSKRFRAAASLSGSPDQWRFVTGRGDIVPFDSWNDAEYKMRSPLAFATSFKCPTRLYWGNQEDFFDKTTRELARRASAGKLDVEAIQVEGDHSTMVRPAMTLAIAFFQQHR